MAVGDYEQIEKSRIAAWKRMRSTLHYGPREEHEEAERRYDDLGRRREAYLRALLARLPFRWYIAHAYTSNETASYGGADHIVVDEPLHVGRLKRDPGDALSRTRAKFLHLARVEEGRLPTSAADIKIAERIVESSSGAKKPSRQIGREVDEILGRR